MWKRRKNLVGIAAAARQWVVPLRNAVRIAAGIFGELSDQSAYQRHLAWHCRTHSPEEWRRFLDSRLRAKFQRAKCC